MAKFAKNDWTVQVKTGAGLKVPVALHIGSRVQFEARALHRNVQGRVGFVIRDRGRILPQPIAVLLAATLGEVRTYADGQLSLPA